VYKITKSLRRIEMNPVIKFLASKAGRVTRIVVGIILAVIGFVAVDNLVLGAILMVIGLVFIAAGTFDFCLLAPLFKLPLSGSKIRAR
jgi:hypothetical protein